ncbi:MAG: vitamin B12 dependent-methionine synthase activation domain-containing protein [Anaerovoracaceae bacterium]
MGSEAQTEREVYLRREVLRYLGMGAAAESDTDPRILEGIEAALAELRRRTRPRFLRKICPLDFCGASGELLSVGGLFSVKSRSLQVNLRDCSQVVLFAATLGAEADQLIRRASCRDISQGLIMEAAATAWIEDFCDTCQMKIEEEMNRQEKTLRPRFSPGYGDFDIAYQKDMIRLLDTPRQLGVSLTEGGMLVPSKSVTAVMGVASRNGGENSGSRQRCHIHGCEACNKKDCLYRRNK